MSKEEPRRRHRDLEGSIMLRSIVVLNLLVPLLTPALACGQGFAAGEIRTRIGYPGEFYSEYKITELGHGYDPEFPMDLNYATPFIDIEGKLVSNPVFDMDSSFSTSRTRTIRSRQLNARANAYASFAAEKLAIEGALDTAMRSADSSTWIEWNITVFHYAGYEKINLEKLRYRPGIADLVAERGQDVFHNQYGRNFVHVRHRANFLTLSVRFETDQSMTEESLEAMIKASFKRIGGGANMELRATTKAEDLFERTTVTTRVKSFSDPVTGAARGAIAGSPQAVLTEFEKIVAQVEKFDLSNAPVVGVDTMPYHRFGNLGLAKGDDRFGRRDQYLTRLLDAIYAAADLQGIAAYYLENGQLAPDETRPISLLAQLCSRHISLLNVRGELVADGEEKPASTDSDAFALRQIHKADAGFSESDWATLRQVVPDLMEFGGEGSERVVIPYPRQVCWPPRKAHELPRVIMVSWEKIRYEGRNGEGPRNASFAIEVEGGRLAKRAVYEIRRSDTGVPGYPNRTFALKGGVDLNGITIRASASDSLTGNEVDFPVHIGREDLLTALNLIADESQEAKRFDFRGVTQDKSAAASDLLYLDGRSAVKVIPSRIPKASNGDSIGHWHLIRIWEKRDRVCDK